MVHNSIQFTVIATNTDSIKKATFKINVNLNKSY